MGPHRERWNGSLYGGCPCNGHYAKCGSRARNGGKGRGGSSLHWPRGRRSERGHRNMICGLFPLRSGICLERAFESRRVAADVLANRTGQKIVGKISPQHLVGPVESPIIAITSDDVLGSVSNYKLRRVVLVAEFCC